MVLRIYDERVALRATSQSGEVIFKRDLRCVSSLSYGDNADAAVAVAERIARDLRARGYSVFTVLIYGGAQRISVAIERQFDLCTRGEDLMAAVLRELYGDGTVLFISPKERMTFVGSDGRAVTYSRGLPDGLLEMVESQIRYFRPDRLVIGGESDRSETASIARICAENGVTFCGLTEKEAAEHSVGVLRAICKSIARVRE